MSEPLLIDTKELQRQLSASKHTAVKIGDEAGARVQYGKFVRWDLEAIREHLRKVRK